MKKLSIFVISIILGILSPSLFSQTKLLNVSYDPTRELYKAINEKFIADYIALSIVFLVLLLIAPLILVFERGFSKGIEVYIKSLTDKEALSALGLTLTVAAWVIPFNTLFGIMAAYAITRFRFKGKSVLTTIIDLPFAVSPVISGLIFVILFGARTPLGEALGDMGIKIVFNTPGIILATIFVTLPFVVRELIPLMQSLGTEEEEAASTLSARGFKIFWRITLPNIKWALLYGMILCNARAIGEFGAVSVISGHIRGETNTLPLHVEILYGEYQISSAFAVSTILVFIGLFTIFIKSLVERKNSKILLDKKSE